MKPSTSRRVLTALALSSIALAEVACNKESRSFETTIEVVQVQRFGQADKASLMDLEFGYADCPGAARRVVRADKAFSQCIGDIKAGDRVSASLRHAWNAERAAYRNEVVKIGNCALEIDPKEEANYETVQSCSDFVATGVAVGVHCDRSRPEKLVAQCPWLRRN